MASSWWEKRQARAGCVLVQQEGTGRAQWAWERERQAWGGGEEQALGTAGEGGSKNTEELLDQNRRTP